MTSALKAQWADSPVSHVHSCTVVPSGHAGKLLRPHSATEYDAWVSHTPAHQMLHAEENAAHETRPVQEKSVIGPRTGPFAVLPVTRHSSGVEGLPAAVQTASWLTI